MIQPRRQKRIHAATAKRRRDILRAALACFSEIGFSRTTMADICRRARASTGSLYHQFASKEELAAELYLEGISDYQAGWIAALEAQADAKAGIRAVISYYLTWVRANEDWARYLFTRRHSVLTPAAEQKFEQLRADFLRRAAQWFGPQVEAGRLRRLPVDIYIALLAGPYLEYTRQYLSGGACTPVKKAAELLAEAAWQSIAVHSAAAPPSDVTSPAVRPEPPRRKRRASARRT